MSSWITAPSGSPANGRRNKVPTFVTTALLTLSTYGRSRPVRLGPHMKTLFTGY